MLYAKAPERFGRQNAAVDAPRKQSQLASVGFYCQYLGALEAVLTPEQFVRTLDSWTSAGGEFPTHAFSNHYLTTAEEAAAVVRALASKDLLSPSGALSTPSLHKVAGLVQSTFDPIVDDIFRREACPLLREIVTQGLHENFTPLAGDDQAATWALKKRAESYLLALKVLTYYGHREDGRLLTTAARIAAFDDSFMWSIIFDYAARNNPAAPEVLESLRTPLPDRFCRIAYLDFANRLAFDGRAHSHPFDTEEGLEFLLSKLKSTDSGYESYAVSAIAAAPFISRARRSLILDRAHGHSQRRIHEEARWAEARARMHQDDDFLTNAALTPQTATRARRYLSSLGLPSPAPTRPEEFEALVRASDWLTGEQDFFGRPPDDLLVVDQRELRWPPNGENRRSCIVFFRYQSEEEDRTEGHIIICGGIVSRYLPENSMNPLEAYSYVLIMDPEIFDAYNGRSRSESYWQELMAQFNPMLQ